MKHEDFLGQYIDIKKKETAALNDALERYKGDNPGEYHFKENEPWVMVTPHNADRSSEAKVLAVKAPVTQDCGIFVETVDDGEKYEVGYLQLAFCDIDTILDNLPEPKKAYILSWDGGNLPRRRETFMFECDADAMKAAREFMVNHHIDIINVFDGIGNQARHVVSYSK